MYTSMAPWYEDVFPLDEAKRRFVLDRLLPGSSVLDVGCGTGELARILAEAGHAIVASDLDQSMITEGLRRAPHLDLRVADMRTVWAELGGARFDAVLCLGNTLVHLASAEEIGALLARAHAALARGGLLMVQIVNYDRVLDQELTGLPTLERERVRFVRDYAPEGEHLRFTTTLTVRATGQVIRDSVRLLPLRRAPLDGLLSAAGFAELSHCGGYGGGPLGPDSQGLVVTAVAH